MTMRGLAKFNPLLSKIADRGFRVEPAASNWLPHRPVRAQLRHTVEPTRETRMLPSFRYSVVAASYPQESFEIRRIL